MSTNIELQKVINYIHEVKACVEEHLKCTFHSREQNAVFQQTFENEGCRLAYEVLQPIFQEIQHSVDTINENRIGFLGERGSGKTSMINSIIGYELLPVGEYAATTACITEVCGWEKNLFHATIYFLSVDEWNSELQQVQDIEKYDSDHHEEVEDDTESKNILQCFKEKLNSMWGGNIPDSVQGPPMFLPPEVLKLIHKGFVSYSFSTPDEMQACLDKFINKEGKIWPVVTKVYLRGPFENLVKGNFSLLDIPGNNDGSISMQKLYEEGLNAASVIFALVDTRLLLNANTVVSQLISDPDIAVRFGLSNMGIVYSKLDIKSASKVMKTDPNIDALLDAWRAKVEKNISGINGQEFVGKLRTYRFKFFMCNSMSGVGMSSFIQNGLTNPTAVSINDTVRQLFQRIDALFTLATDCMKSTKEDLVSLESFLRHCPLTCHYNCPPIIIDKVTQPRKEGYNDLFQFMNRLWHGHLKSVFSGEYPEYGIQFVKLLIAELMIVSNVRNYIYKTQKLLFNFFEVEIGSYISKLSIKTPMEGLLKRVLMFNLQSVKNRWVGEHTLFGRLFRAVLAVLRTDSSFRGIRSEGSGCMARMKSTLLTWLDQNRDSLISCIVRLLYQELQSEINLICQDFTEIAINSAQQFLNFANMTSDKSKILQHFLTFRADLNFVHPVEPEGLTAPTTLPPIHLVSLPSQLEKQFRDNPIRDLLTFDPPALQTFANLRARYRPGFVYILKNSSYNDGILKIGLTKKIVQDRSKQLYTTGVPGPFEIVFSIECRDIYFVETIVHQIFSLARVNPKREFFSIPESVAQWVVENVSNFDKQR